jgi:hypothetical protein
MKVSNISLEACCESEREYGNNGNNGTDGKGSKTI